jgi:hypothetical protein
VALRDKLLSGIADRQIFIRFPNGEYSDISSGIISGTARIEEILCDGDLDFSQINSSIFECDLETSIDFTGLKIYVFMIVASLHTVDLFTGYVDSCSSIANKTERHLIAYDPIYTKGNIDVSAWYLGLTFPMTLKTFRNSLFSYIGIAQLSQTLVNDNMVISETVVPEILIARDVISKICEINGVFGTCLVNAETFKYVSLDNVSTYAISDNYFSSDSTFENYETAAISKVVVRSEENDIGTASGSGTNVYNIIGNWLTFGLDSTALNTVVSNLYTKLSTVSYVYRPSSISQRYSEPNIVLGSKITLVTYTGQSVTTYLLKKELSGVQLFNMRIISSGGKDRSNVTMSAENQFQVLQNKSHVFRNDIDGLYSQVFDGDGNSIISQTSDQISWIVSSGTNETDFTITDRTAELVADYINLSGLVEFTGISDDAIDSVISEVDFAGRNMIVSSQLLGVLDGGSSQKFQIAGYGANLISNANVLAMFDPGEEYTITFSMKMIEMPLGLLTTRKAGISLYSSTGTTIDFVRDDLILEKDTITISATFTCPAITDHTLKIYTNSYGGTGAICDVMLLQITKGPALAQWQPSPFDITYEKNSTIINGGLIDTDSLFTRNIFFTGSIYNGKDSFDDGFNDGIYLDRNGFVSGGANAWESYLSIGSNGVINIKHVDDLGEFDGAELYMDSGTLALTRSDSPGEYTYVERGFIQLTDDVSVRGVSTYDAIYDSGWKSPTIITGSAYTAFSDGIFYRRKGPWLEITGQVTNVSALPATIFRLGTDYRPDKNRAYKGVSGSNFDGKVSIETDGYVKWQTYSGTFSTSAYIDLHCVLFLG